MAGDESYAFMYAGVHEAPNASGLYTIYSPQRWVYVGESDDIRQSLFRLLNDSPAWMGRFGPCHFRLSGRRRMNGPPVGKRLWRS